MRLGISQERRFMGYKDRQECQGKNRTTQKELSFIERDKLLREANRRYLLGEITWQDLDYYRKLYGPEWLRKR